MEPTLIMEAEDLPDKRADNILLFDKTEKVDLFKVKLKWDSAHGKESLWSHSLNIQNSKIIYAEHLFLEQNPVDPKIEPVKLENTQDIELDKVHYPVKFERNMIKQISPNSNIKY